MAEIAIITGIIVGSFSIKFFLNNSDKNELKRIIYKERTTKKINEKCIICYEKMNDRKKKYKLYCEHTYHKKCMKRWLRERATCPLCNLPLLTRRGKRVDVLYH